MPKRKCQICGEFIEHEEEWVPYKNRYAHAECFNLAMKMATQGKKEKLQEMKHPAAKAPKKQKELKDGLAEDEYQEKVQLCDYIRSLIHEDLSPKVYKLMEDYYKKYKISYSEMLTDLKWYFEELENPVAGDVIGIVPYIHGDAQKYYADIKRAQEDCKTKMDQITEMYQEKTMRIQFLNERRIKQIDLNSLELNEGAAL